MQKTRLFNLFPDTVYRTVKRFKLPPSVSVLMYHEVLPDDIEVDAWIIVRESDFRRQVKHIVKEFTVISIDQACNLHRAGELDGKRYVVLTFDDGYYGNASVVSAVAEEYEIPYTVYVASAAVMQESLYWYDRVIVNCNEPGFQQIDLQARGLGQYRFRDLVGYQRWEVTQSLLSDLKKIPPEQREQLVAEFFPLPAHSPLRFMRVEELADLAASELVTIGGHSHCHNRLVQLDKEGIDNTVRENKALLEQWTGQLVEHFAYPNGDYNDDVVTVLRAQGFKTAVTTESGVWQVGKDAYLIPRYAVGRYEPMGYFKAKLSGMFL